MGALGVLVGTLVAAIVLRMVVVRRARRRSLAIVQSLLADATVGPGRARVSGSFRGFPVTWSFGTYRPELTVARDWTRVEVSLPETLPLSLRLRKQTEQETQIRRYGLVDLELGDRAFDDAFSIDGNPADAVRRLLSPALRKRLLALKPLDLACEPGQVILGKVRWIVDQRRIEALVELAVAIAEALPRAVGETQTRVE